LPSSVRVVLRAHGSLELIQLAEESWERVISPSDSQTLLMHRLERCSIVLADMVLSSVASTTSLYTKVYDLPSTRLVLLPPPMNTVLRSFVPLPRARGPKPLFLVYGKMHLGKGTKVMLAAAVKLLERHGNDAAAFVFAGLDQFCEKKDYKCIAESIPEAMRQSFTFRSAIKRQDLAQLVRSVDYGVFPSMSETLGMAVHEVAKLRVPLVVSDIPAFAEFFNKGNAITFTAGSVSSLFEALEVALKTPVAERKIAAPSYVPSEKYAANFYSLVTGSMFRSSAQEAARVLRILNITLPAQ